MRKRGSDLAIGGESVSHVFSNPYGRLHEIITVRRAQGLLVAGPPTEEFTWFSGYAWEVAYCVVCHAHLGWKFTSAQDSRDPPTFFGLLRGEVIEPSRSREPR